MPNLTITAYYTRRMIKFSLIGFVLLLILRVFWGIGSTYWQKAHPAPPPKPTVSFGKLPALSFPQKENLPTLSYRLETIEGSTPKLTEVGKVYLMPKPVASLLAFDRAKELAKKMGFQTEPTKISERVFRFEGQNSLSTLEIDIISQKFNLSYNFTSDQSVFSEKKLPNEEQAVMEAKSFLRQINLLSEDLEKGQAKTSYLKFSPPNLVSAISLSEADFVKVDLFRAKLDDLNVFPSHPNEAPVSFLFSGARELGKRVIQVNYFHQTVSQENSATYPLKSSGAAWEELISGKGYVASLGENQEGKIIIRKIYLAYFEAEAAQDFLQPIFVFEGDRDFMAYVPAIDPKWSE